MTNLVVRSDKRLTFDGRDFRCAVGRGGRATAKREGDGMSPVGLWPLRRVLFRADRLARPKCVLPVQTLALNDGWSDDPGHGDYNRQVVLPHGGHCEKLWRDDHVYDIIVVLGYNDKPIVRGAGSAIFLHLARQNYAPTEGCVALSETDMRHVLSAIDRDTCLEILA